MAFFSRVRYGGMVPPASGLARLAAELDSRLRPGPVVQMRPWAAHRDFVLLAGLLLVTLSLSAPTALAQCPYNSNTFYSEKGTLAPSSTPQSYYYDRGAQINPNTPYWLFDAVYGATYSFSNCTGANEDTHLYLQRVNSGTAAPVIYNDDNGPACAGIKPSLQWTCAASDQYTVTLAHNINGCDGTLTGDQYLTYRVTYPTPVLTSAAPNPATPGTAITLTGNGFLTASAVAFGGTSNNVATSLTLNATGTQLTVVVPTGATTGNVTVTTLGGTSNGLAFTVLNTLQLTARTPALNTNAASLTANLDLTFDQALASATAGNVRVFSSQRGGQLVRNGNATASGSTLTINPASDLRAGEVVQVSVPPTVTSTGGLPARRQVYQFTAGASPASGGVFTGSGTVVTASANQVGLSVPADLDGDGDLDLARLMYVSNSGTSYIDFLQNNGSGGFSLLAPTLSLGSYRAGYLVAGDIDSDGDLDLLVSSAADFTGIRLFKNAGNGNFGAVSLIDPGVGGGNINLGDIDADGDLDLVSCFTYLSSHQVVDYKNDGTGVFTQFANLSILGEYPRYARLADTDLDGDLDVVLIGDVNRLVVALNNGTGQLSEQPAVPLQSNRSTYDLQVADLNGDGKLDALVLTFDFNTSAATLYVFAGSGAGSFAAPSSVTVANYMQSLTLGDIDGDGDLDLLLGSGFSSIFPTLYRNTGTGSFGSPTSLAVNGSQTSQLVDLDNDNDLDILVSGTNTGNQGVTYARFNQQAVPTLTSASPNPVANGALLTLTGTGFLNASAVRLNGVAMTGYTVVSPTSLTFTVPAGAVSGSVTVTTPGGTSSALPVTINNAPTALALSATSILENTGPNAVVGNLTTTDPDAGNTFAYTLVSGTGAIDNAAFNISGSQLRLTASPDFESKSSYVVRVRTTDQGGVFFEQAFTISILDLAAPTLTSISPDTGLIGSSVTLTGSSLTGATVVTFPGTSNNTVTTGLTSSGTNPNQTLTVAVPSGATLGSGTVTVTTPEGMTAAVPFTVTSPLLVTSLTPARNAKNAPRTTNVGLTFNQAVNAATAGNVRVFSAQRGGQLVRGGNATASGNTLTVDPANDLKAGETVQVTVPTTVTSSAGPAASKHVYQFTAGVSTTGLGYFPGAGSNVAVGTSPRAVTAADVDGDDDLDVLTSNKDDGTVSVRLNNGSGALPTVTTVSVGSNPNDVMTADVDGDGDLDLLAANANASGTVAVRLNNGTGSFSGSTSVSVGSSPVKLTLGDVDGDGDLDLLTANGSANSVSVRLNDGSGNFSGGSDVAVNTLPYGVEVGDVDADGDLDILCVTGNGSSSSVSVRLNNGSGVFSGTTEVPVGINAYSMTVGDVDGDGDLDLLAGCVGSATVSVRFNNGSGSFSGTTEIPMGGGTRSVKLGDVDGDGDLDLLVATYSANAVAIRLNNGTGVFSGTANVAVGTGPFGAAPADVDGDGDLDIIAVNADVNTVSVRFNQTPAPTLTSLSPTSGPVGTSVTLTGTNFSAGSTVSFNGTAATSVTYTAATSLTVVVPAGATTGNVTVTTAGGTTGGVSFTVTVPVPTLTSLSPMSGPVGTSVTLTGTGFTGATSVKFGPMFFNYPATFTVVNATTITATVPAGPNNGANDVIVTTPGGTSNAQTFTIASLATVTTYPPSDVTGTEANLGGQTTNSGGAAVTNVGVVYSTTNTLPTLADTRVSAGSGMGSFIASVTGLTPTTTYYVRAYAINSVGTSYGAAFQFTTLALPALTGLSPTSGPVGTVVTLTGTDFTGVTGVSFNGTAATVFNVVSATSATATVPTGATTGNVTITTEGGTSNGLPFMVITNQAPTALGLSPQSVAENTAGGTAIGNFSTTDPDAGNTFTYALVSGVGSTDNGAFSISGSQLVSTAAPNFEAQASYAIRVRTTDQDGLFTEQVFSILVTNVNEAPVIGAQTRAIAENSANSTAVGAALTATDPDASPTLTYSILSGNPSGVFAIDGSTGQLTVNGALNFEGTAAYSLVVRVSDGTLTDQATVTVNISDVNEAPTNLTLSNSSIAETTGANVVVGSLSTSDPDAGNTFTYSLVGGAGSADNTLVNINGDEVRITADPDFETKSSYAIRVRTTDQDGLFTERAFTLTITDVLETPANDPPVNIFLSNANVAENAASATVGLLTTADGDVTDTHTYSLVNGAGSSGNTAFQIVGDELRTAAGLDFETQSSYSVRIRSADSGAGNLFVEKSFTLTVTDVAEPLTVSAAASVPAGLYSTLTVTSTGTAILAGPVTVTTALTVQGGGVLQTNCQPITGSGTFTLAAVATLDICNAQGISASGATGAVQLTGTRAFSPDAHYIYSAPGTQVTGLGLPARVRSLTKVGAGTLTLSQPVRVRQYLSLTGTGNLVLDGNTMTLLSTADTTACLFNLSTGRVLGATATVQRYLSPAFNAGVGYRHLASPVQSTTVADLTTSGFTAKVNAAYNALPTPSLPATTYPNVFGYDETRGGTTLAYAGFNTGFFSPTALSNVLTPGRGYTVSIRGGLTPDFVGALTQDDVTLSLSRTGTPGASPDNTKSGWQLIGNPFASLFDWDLVNKPAGLAPTMSVFRSTGPNSGAYLVRTNGVGGIPNGIVAPGQAFFVRVDGPGPVSLTLLSSARVNTLTNVAIQRPGTPVADTRPLVRLTLRGANAPVNEHDEAFVYFEAGATADVDTRFDGQRPAHNQGAVPTLVSLTAAGQELAVNGLPESALTAGTTVELLLDLPSAGAYALTAVQLAYLPAGAALLDRTLGTRTALVAGARYAFTSAQAGIVAGRFALEVAPAGTVTGHQAAADTPPLTLWPNPASGGTVRVLGVAVGNAVRLLDATGRVVRVVTATAEGAALDVAGVPAGVYTVRAGALTQRLVVE